MSDILKHPMVILSIVGLFGLVIGIAGGFGSVYVVDSPVVMIDDGPSDEVTYPDGVWDGGVTQEYSMGPSLLDESAKITITERKSRNNETVALRKETIKYDDSSDIVFVKNDQYGGGTVVMGENDMYAQYQFEENRQLPTGENDYEHVDENERLVYQTFSVGYKRYNMLLGNIVGQPDAPLLKDGNDYVKSGAFEPVEVIQYRGEKAIRFELNDNIQVSADTVDGHIVMSEDGFVYELRFVVVDGTEKYEYYLDAERGEDTTVNMPNWVEEEF